MNRTDRPTDAQLALLVRAADGPVDLFAKNAKTVGACLRRGWLKGAGGGVLFELTEAGLEAATR